MRNFILIALAATTLAATGTAAGSTYKAQLAVTGSKPVVVRGTHFRSRERITVTLVMRSTRTHHVRATREGTFRTSFDATRDRCSTFLVRAIGSRGSCASVKLPLPMCAPARSGEAPG